MDASQAALWSSRHPAGRAYIGAAGLSRVGRARPARSRTPAHHAVRGSRLHRAAPGPRVGGFDGARPAVPAGLRRAPANGGRQASTRARRPYARRDRARARGVLPPRATRAHRLARSRTLPRDRLARDAKRAARPRGRATSAEARRRRAAGHAGARRRRRRAPAEELAALCEALDRLERLDARQARVVECRFFGGLSLDETAEALGVSAATVSRDWTTARAWLHAELAEGPTPDTRAPG